MKKIRSHPINILENTSKYLILLLFPVIRALFTTPDGFTAWLSGAWFDLLIIGLILALGIYQWYSFTFSIDSAGIYMEKGILLKQSRNLPFQNMTAISVERPWYFLPFRAVRVKADTDGGSPRKSDFSITVTTTLSDELLWISKASFSSEPNITRIYIPRNLYIVFFSFLTSNSITGVFYLFATLSQTGKILGKEFSEKLMNTFTDLAIVLNFGLPPFFAVIAYIILGCWGISFLLNMERHLRFSTSRLGGTLDIKCGLFSRHHYSITVKRINFLLIRQSLLSKLFGFMSVFIHCTGYGKEKNELSVLFPAGMNHDIQSNLNLILPDIPFAKKQIKSKLLYLSRFLFPPGCLILTVLALGLFAIYEFPDFRGLFTFLLIIAEIPCIWWLFVKIFSFFFTGIGVSDDVVTLYYTYGYQILSCSIPKHKISKIEISQSLFQLTTQCCDVLFYTYAEKRKRHRVPSLNLPEVMELLDLADRDFSIILEEPQTKRK
jgi:putative membrane protein